MLPLLVVWVLQSCVILTTYSEPLPDNLVDELRRGGYTIYFRHAPTEWSQRDQVSTLADCSSCDPKRMRQLSDEGRDMARRVGDAMRKLGIPVGEVLASEYCRTVETAKLLGLGRVTTTRDVINARVASLIGGREKLRRAARAHLSAPPAEGTNTVIVAHGNVFLLAAGTRPAELGAAVVRADGEGGFSVEAMLDPEDWIELAISPR
ncbi:MAG: histidine phosphatase family protein [Gammaproteobacteria bacterium]